MRLDVMELMVVMPLMRYYAGVCARVVYTDGWRVMIVHRVLSVPSVFMYNIRLLLFSFFFMRIDVNVLFVYALCRIVCEYNIMHLRELHSADGLAKLCI